MTTTVEGALYRILAANLRKARHLQQLTQKELAKKSGYCKGYIQGVENARKVNPTLAFVEAVAGVLGIHPLDLLVAHRFDS